MSHDPAFMSGAELHAEKDRWEEYCRRVADKTLEILRDDDELREILFREGLMTELSAYLTGDDDAGYTLRKIARNAAETIARDILEPVSDDEC